MNTVTPAAAPIISLRSVKKTYWRGTEAVKVLDGLDLDIPAGSFEALMGPSGSGKSTLLNLVAGLDRPTSGTITVGGKDIGALGESPLAKWRAGNLGFIFQQFNLLPVLSAEQNVALPLLLHRMSAAERKKRALTALRIVGLEDRSNHFPRQLSGGQEQRVAIARALVSDPSILIADEPTGNLDRESTQTVLDLLQKLNRDFGKTIVMVTHDPHAAECATVIRRLDKGVMV